MNRSRERTFRTAAFAALAGVTSRTLHHYDRLGLLKPKRSHSGYRIYSERDLEVLEQIVALKFIGVPLRKIAALRRRSPASFADVLRAQRATLEKKRQVMTRAIEAIGRAETSIRAGALVDAALFRHIIEVMQMDKNSEDMVETYSAMLRSKIAHLMAMSAEQRDNLRRSWDVLVADIRAAIARDEKPDSPAGQQLLDRWLSQFQAATGADTKTAAEQTGSAAFKATPELRDALWARRAEWMPDGSGSAADTAVSAEQARARAEQLSQSFASPEVLAFIRRARDARG